MTDTVETPEVDPTVSGLGPEVRRLIERVRATKRPLVIAPEGEDAVVLLEAEEYERLQRRLALHQLVLEGKQDVIAGRIHTQAEAEAMMDDWFAGK